MEEGETQIHSSLRTVEWKDNKVVMIDQTKLPNELVFVEYDDFNQVADAIRTLIVRGAPAIGVSGAFGLALAGLQSNASSKDELILDLEKAKKILFETRPTAINLKWGLEKIMNVANNGTDDYIKTKERWEILKEFFEKEEIDYKEVFSISGSILTKLINLIYLFDYTSIYKAVLTGIDPTPVKAIDFVKKRL